MYVANRREANDLASLAKVLGDAPREGVDMAALVAGTGLPSWRIERLLSKHQDYFVRVGGRDAFALNRFGKCKGSAEATTRDIERAYRTGRALRTVAYAGGALLAVGGLAAGAWSLRAPEPSLLAPSAVLAIVGVVLLAGALYLSR